MRWLVQYKSTSTLCERTTRPIFELCIAPGEIFEFNVVDLATAGCWHASDVRLSSRGLRVFVAHYTEKSDISHPRVEPNIYCKHRFRVTGKFLGSETIAVYRSRELLFKFTATCTESRSLH